MEDYIPLLRQNDAVAHADRQKRETARLAREADVATFNGILKAVCDACQDGDLHPDSIPNLSPFIALAGALRDKGWDACLPELAESFAGNLDHPFEYRPGHLFFLQLLISAGKPRATAKKLAAIYKAFIPSAAPRFWRGESARYIAECIATRVSLAHEAELVKRRTDQEEAEKQRLERLRRAAAKRSAIEKQLFAVYWTSQGLKPAEIRDRWNEANPNQLPENGAAARKDIRIAIVRGNDFLAAHKTTISEMVSLLGLTH